MLLLLQLLSILCVTGRVQWMTFLSGYIAWSCSCSDRHQLANAAAAAAAATTKHLVCDWQGTVDDVPEWIYRLVV